MTNEEPWHCHDCGEKQELKTAKGGRTWYSNAGWYWVQLHPGEKPVYLDLECFESYNNDWPDYDGTHKSSPWHGGEWQGKFVWVLPADYFARRDAYRLLPRWERVADGWRLTTHEGRTLGWVVGASASPRGRSRYHQLDAARRRLSDSTPMGADYAMGAVEVYLGLGGDGMVQR